MNLLIIYYNCELKVRSTFLEYLKAFENYSTAHVYYLNVAWRVPFFLQRLHFDAIIYHYSAVGLKWTLGGKFLFSKNFDITASFSGLKIAMPQDEYVLNEVVWKFFKIQGINTIYSCFFEEDYQKAYPHESSGLIHYFTVFPGYVDELAVKKMSAKLPEYHSRTIDLGYRARKNPFWLGSIGVLKWQVTEVFEKWSQFIRMDISNDPGKTIIGEDWYKFLANCKCVLGVESGSSVIDIDGRIRQRVEQYTNSKPNAEFDEVMKNCFPGLDGSIGLATLSPRHFEACITKTCQVLVEGNYAGVLKPGLHYIEVKKDWSNIEEVISLIKDEAYCQTLAEKAYEDIILSEKYTYRKLVNEILSFIRSHRLATKKNEWYILYYLKLRYYLPFILHPIDSSWQVGKLELKKILVRKGWMTWKN